MKRFSLGLAVGAGFGVVLSLFKDKNGDRLFPPVQKQIKSVKEDISDISEANNKFKAAQQELKKSLPLAKKAASELQNEIEYYQISINRIIGKLKAKTATINFNSTNETNSSKK
ncbi:hypothetical protein [uncultured Lactobacillus sp.]|uniref:hypothetical protein n=1 Tax=uncultured Lactobacillus sp. TaxID=153152 RepID=UPI0025FC15DA|nr:hypothetical protein [uncultured Lactobacillus sp.]